MKKILSVLLLCLFSQSSFAFFKKSDSYYVNKCFDTGIQKVISQAEGYNCLDLDDYDLAEEYIYSSSIDNRFWNPSTYIWYALDTDCDGLERIQVLVQHAGGECF